MGLRSVAAVETGLIDAPDRKESQASQGRSVGLWKSPCFLQAKDAREEVAGLRGGWAKHTSVTSGSHAESKQVLLLYSAYSAHCVCSGDTGMP